MPRGKKDFIKGMEAGAKPFEEKFQKLSEETEKIGKKVNDKLDNMGNIMDVLMDDLSDMQKKELYHLNTPYDLKNDLDNDEKEIVAAALLRLSEYTDNNEYQQKFIRSVNSYININTPQMGFDFINIENIENIKSQKIILQTIMEYLFLAKEDFTFLEELEEIFEHFSVNKKGVKEVEGYIETVYHAVGKAGIAEKYGFVPKEDAKPKQTLVKESMFPCYDGSDISEACADKVNIHHHYVTLKDYLIYVEKHLQDIHLFCVHKQTGEKREIEINIESKSSIKEHNICGYGENFFLLLSTGIYRAKADTFHFTKMEISNFQMENLYHDKYDDEKYFPQCNEKHLVFLGERGPDRFSTKSLLCSINLDSLICQEILSDKLEKANSGIDGFKLVKDSILVNDDGKSVYRYDLVTNEKKKIADISSISLFEFLKPEKYYNDITEQYGKFVFSSTSEEMSCVHEDCLCNCIDLENDKFTSAVLQNTGNTATFVAYHYIYYLKKDSSIGRYDILTGQYENVINSTKTISFYEEGFLRKKVTRLIIKPEIQLQVVGKWLYYSEPYKTVIHKISLDSKKCFDVILNVQGMD